MKRVSIHQPQYIPWVPFFDKILQSDIFVFLDNVQFQNNGIQNRNQIKGSQGPIWLTLPVKHNFGQRICDTRITDTRVASKHLKSIEINYKKASCYDEVFALISEALDCKTDNLSQICCKSVIMLLDYLGYRGEIYKSSELGTEGKSNELLINICKEVNADIYISGQGGKDYLDLESFKRSKIQVVFQNYKNQEYAQCFPKVGFCPDLSIVDLLFNKGRESLAVIEAGRIDPHYAAPA